MIRLTRRYTFASSHRLHSPRLAEEQNRAIYGKCNNPHGHGHNYVLAVSVRGPVDRKTGQTVHLGTLDGIVREHVLAAFDHRNLNQEVPAFQGATVPTTENVGREVARRLREAWPSAFPGGWPRLERIRIEETDRNIFEVHESDEGN